MSTKWSENKIPEIKGTSCDGGDLNIGEMGAPTPLPCLKSAPPPCLDPMRNLSLFPGSVNKQPRFQRPS